MVPFAHVACGVSDERRSNADALTQLGARSALCGQLMLPPRPTYGLSHSARKRAVIVWSGGLANRQKGQIFRTALQVAVANDRIARRYSGLTERLERAIVQVALRSAG